MLFKQIEYFIAVVETHSFTEAAERLFVSQSAISQQIKSLEKELGVSLLKRENRSFSLTEAGKYFYKESIEIRNNINNVIQKTQEIEDDENVINIGYQRSLDGYEVKKAILEFNKLYPHVHMNLSRGTHEELYQMLLKENNCLVINDQRRKFHDDYINYHLTDMNVYIEISKDHPLSNKDTIDVDDLIKDTCILISPIEQRTQEKEFYKNIIGIKSAYRFANDLEEARLMVEMNRGFIPIERVSNQHENDRITLIPLTSHGKLIQRKYCAFWVKEKTNYYLEEFAEILKRIYNASK